MRPLRPRLLFAVFAALLIAACSPEREVYRNLTQRDANEMVALLQRASIASKREEVGGGGYRITVGDGDFGRAVEILSTAGYPRETYRSLAEIFPGEGLIVTPFEQRARMTFALNQELSRTITTVEGVTSARVHVVVPELDLRGQPQTRASASVVVHHRAGVDTAELSGKVKLIVANAVQGLSFRDVSVSFFTTGLPPAPAGAAPGGAAPAGRAEVAAAPPSVPSQAAPPPAPASPAPPAPSPAAEAAPTGFASWLPGRGVLWAAAGALALLGLALLFGPRWLRTR